MSVHPTAIIAPEARIGRGVEIGAYSVIGGHVRLGDGCKVHHHATIDGYTTLGDSCVVFPQAVIGTQPQDIKFDGEQTFLEIGGGNVFRELVTVHPGTGNGGGLTRIGDNNLFLIGSHVAHDCRIGNNCILANYVQFAGHVHVEDNVNMGGHSAVHHFVTVGKHAFIGGMTRVTADVPPFVVVVAARGTRSEVRMINGVGLQRSGYGSDDINALKDAFMRIFARRARNSGVSIQDRVHAVLGAPTVNPQVRYLGEFLLRSFAHGRNGRYLESLRSDRVHRTSWKVPVAPCLTVHVAGRGTVQRNSAGTNDQRHQVYELTATADPGWAFSGWNGTLDGRENPARIVVDRDQVVTATFAETHHRD